MENMGFFAVRTPRYGEAAGLGAGAIVFAMQESTCGSLTGFMLKGIWVFPFKCQAGIVPVTQH